MIGTKTERISNARLFWASYMSDEEQQAEPEQETTESVPPLEDHHKEALKERRLKSVKKHQTFTLECLLYLGLAALMFDALFPFPFSADLNTGEDLRARLGMV